MMVVSARPLVVLFLCLNFVSFFVVNSLVVQSCGSVRCYNGEGSSGECDCYPGWYGKSCQYCVGKTRCSFDFNVPSCYAINEGP